MGIQRTFFNKSLILLYLIFALTIAFTYYFYFNSKSNAVAEALNRKGKIYVALIIHDEQKPVLSALFMYNNDTKRGAIFDIPVNYAVTLVSKGKIERIDSLFDVKSPHVYANQMGRLLNIKDPVFYLSLSLESLGTLVDLTQGVIVFLPSPLEDDYGSEILSLPAGSSVLDGAKVREYLLLTRMHNSPSRATELRRKFVQALLSKWSYNSILLTHQQVQGYLQKLVKTNMAGEALTEFWAELAYLDVDSLVSHRIQGSLRTLEGQSLLFPHSEGRLVRELVTQTETLLAATDITSALAWPRRLEIQNGTAISGLAIRTALIYEALGYDVVRVGNSFNNTVDYTTIIDFSGNMEAALRVGEVIRTTRVYSFDLLTDVDDSAIDNNVDIRIILGSDFDGRYTQQLNDLNDFS